MIVDLELLIKALLMLDGNEANLLSRGNQDNFRKIIVQVLRIKYGVRYHDYDRECRCQPECKIKQLLEDSELKEFLKEYNVMEYIDELIEKPINKNETVWSD